MCVLNFLSYVDVFKNRQDFVAGVMTTEVC